jgi:uncharacterized protein (TIGR03083 family)
MPSASAVIGLMERAITYALEATDDLPAGSSYWPTPCREWDLRMLLDHLGCSTAMLEQTLLAGAPQPVAPLRDRMLRDRMLGLPGLLTRRLPLTVEGCPIGAVAVAAAGALEFAVHGWDINQACGRQRRIPAPLAVELLTVAPLVVPQERGSLFEQPVGVGPSAAVDERLVAFLGRDPHEGRRRRC